MSMFFQIVGMISIGLLTIVALLKLYYSIKPWFCHSVLRPLGFIYQIKFSYRYLTTEEIIDWLKHYDQKVVKNGWFWGDKKYLDAYAVVLKKRLAELTNTKDSQENV